MDSLFSRTRLVPWAIVTASLLVLLCLDTSLAVAQSNRPTGSQSRGLLDQLRSLSAKASDVLIGRSQSSRDAVPTARNTSGRSRSSGGQAGDRSQMRAIGTPSAGRGTEARARTPSDRRPRSEPFQSQGHPTHPGQTTPGAARSIQSSPWVERLVQTRDPKAAGALPSATSVRNTTGNPPVTSGERTSVAARNRFLEPSDASAPLEFRLSDQGAAAAGDVLDAPVSVARQAAVPAAADPSEPAYRAAALSRTNAPMNLASDASSVDLPQVGPAPNAPPHVSRVPLPRKEAAAQSNGPHKGVGRLVTIPTSESAATKEVQRMAEQMQLDTPGMPPARSAIASSNPAASMGTEGPAEGMSPAPENAIRLPSDRSFSDLGRNGIEVGNTAIEREGLAAPEDAQAALPTLPLIGGDPSSATMPVVPRRPLPSLPQDVAPRDEDGGASDAPVAAVEPQIELPLPVDAARGANQIAQEGPRDAERAEVPEAAEVSDISEQGDLAASQGAEPNFVRSHVMPPQLNASDLRTHARLTITNPRVSVRLVGPADVAVGIPADYQIVASNEDNLPATGLMLRLELPATVRLVLGRTSTGRTDVESAPGGGTIILWGIERLEAGQTATAPVQLQATEAAEFPVSLQWAVTPVADTVHVNVLSPRLRLAMQGPAEVEYGVPATYRMTVRNEGDALARNVVVQLNAEPYGKSQTVIEEIPAGESRGLELELTFEQRGNVAIQASASAAGGVKAQAALDVVVRRPELEVELAGPQIVFFGDPARYVARVRNQGDTAARELRVQIGLPASADRSLLEGVNGVEVRDGVAVWTIARLEPDQHSELVLPIRLVGEGEQRLGILVEDAVGNRAAGQCVTLVQAVADLKLLVSDPIAPAPVGDDVVYELQLTNRGSKAATNVHVVAQFSEGIEPTRGEGHRYRLVPGQVLFEPLSRIDPNQTVTLKVYAVAQQAGVHRFRADVRADEEIRLVQEESTRYLTVAQNPAGGSTNR